MLKTFWKLETAVEYLKNVSHEKIFSKEVHRSCRMFIVTSKVSSLYIFCMGD